ncbi:MAG: hypothetical protein NC336_09305 [Clostridium sp.]|nr:hypothetical protein [Clostridium sp.]
MKRYSSLLLTTLALFAGMTSCGNRPKAPAEIAEVIVSIDDPEEFSRYVSYPLRRPYPLHDIKDREGMKRYYRTMVDDSLRRSAKHGRWQQFGWRGWSTEEDQWIWIDDGKIYAVTRISPAEQEQIDNLRRAERESLWNELASDDWTPVGCMVGRHNRHVYRIDQSGDSIYRLVVYGSPERMRNKPDTVYAGRVDIEGSIAQEIFRFGSADGMDAIVYIPDTPDGSSPELEYSDSTVEVSPAYWLDILPPEAAPVDSVMQQ